MQKAIIGKKVGMTQIFDESGKVIPVTVIEAGPCVVTQKKTLEQDGYVSVQLGFENINSRPEDVTAQGYGVDHVKVVEGLGCKAIRVHRPEDFAAAMTQAEAWMAEHQTPVVIECILERVTNISMGAEIDNVVEFEELALSGADVPSALAMLD